MHQMKSLARRPPEARACVLNII
ncbi:hypothetical protein CHELA40_13066 [Chelatococcus asaccharovorans]|nr:hypothetical protein CHELA40_13066 [Chelatococcus asaccharovorans]